MTLLEAMTKCGWRRHTLNEEGLAAVETAYAVVLAEAQSAGRRLRGFRPEDVEDAVAIFVGRFSRPTKRPTFTDDDAARGYIFRSVQNNCVEIERAESRRRKRLGTPVGPENLDGVLSGARSPLEDLLRSQAGSELRTATEAARALMPSLMGCVGQRLAELTPAAKALARIALSQTKFKEVAKAIEGGRPPADPAELRAYQRAFYVIRMLLPDCCEQAGLATPGVTRFLAQQATLQAQAEALASGLGAEADPRLRWVFIVVAGWRARCVG